MATYDTPQGTRRIIVRQVTMFGSNLLRVEGMIFTGDGPTTEFTTDINSIDPRRDDELYLAAARLETLLAEAVAIKIGIAPTQIAEGKKT